MSDSPRGRLAAPLLCLALYAAVLRHAPLEARAPVESPASGPSSEELRAWVAEERKALREERWDDLLAVASRLSQRFPANHAYVRDLASAHHARGRFAEESAAWERYVEIAPVPVHACPDYPFSYLRQRRIEDYRRAAERCLAFDPVNSDGLFAAAHASELSGDRSRARELYLRGLELAPDYADLTFGLARIELAEGRPREAERLARAALATRPNDGEGRRILEQARKR